MQWGKERGEQGVNRTANKRAHLDANADRSRPAVARLRRLHTASKGKEDSSALAQAKCKGKRAHALDSVPLPELVRPPGPHTLCLDLNRSQASGCGRESQRDEFSGKIEPAVKTPKRAPIP